MSTEPEQKNDISPAAERISIATPMMRQYLEIKSQNEDAFVFYRLGDFYEMFYEDAVEGSRLLDLTLTTRNKSSADPVPLCGVPHHAVQGYLNKLISLGKKVVICEQMEDPKLAKGLVKREVTRVVSPGIVTEDQSLTPRLNNFLLGVVPDGKQIHCTVCDVSTGLLEFFTLSNVSQLSDEIQRLQVKEVFYPEKENGNAELLNVLLATNNLYHHSTNDLFGDVDFARDLLLTHYGVSSLDSLGLDGQNGAIKVLGLLLGYLKENKLLEKDLLQQPRERKVEKFMVFDENTARNLELFRTLRDQETQGTLLWHLDCCQTPMGSRRLAEFVRTPLLNSEEINERLNVVSVLVQSSETLDALTQILGGMGDLERLANKFITQSAHARDALGLKESLERLPQFKSLCAHISQPLVQQLVEETGEFDALVKKIHKTISPEPSLSIREGGIIAPGVSAELDELREIEHSGKSTIASMEAEERQRTGIGSLKIRYNNVFGYFIDVTHTHREKVPADYIRKQTLSNSERYITPELKQYEDKVLGATERIKNLEYEIFCELRREICEYSSRIKQAAAAVSVIDVLAAFAHTAIKHRYVRPVVTDKQSIFLKGARHPILERLNLGEPFIPNDIQLDSSQNRVLIITGPNMAGKSTIMRMTALIVVMAQMGSFVPCEAAEVGICDRVFTRVGAHDYLQKGMSTFMVEMVETAKILREATRRSLIVLDEIGRGTSTFDGLSIAWAVAEDIHDRIGARTLFATHYHELCDLSEQRAGIKNMNMAVREWNGEIIFLRKLKTGGTNRSYGVSVASMAGLSPLTVARAREILKLLEIKDLSFQSDLNEASKTQMSLFGTQEPAVVKRLREIDPNKLTPLEALQVLVELKESI